MVEPWDESGGPYFLNYYVDEKTTSDEIIKELKVKGKWWRKMSEYKTLDQWFPDGKPDGRKFHNPAWGESMYFVPYFRTVKGTWHGLGENGECFEYPPIYGFKEYVPPKKKRKVTMYCPVYVGSVGLTSYDYFHEDKGNFLNSGNIKGWMTMETEVDE